ncbi:MAG: DUF4330 domain-containing protein [Oscillospiraceae bacterium]|nr:DUF4330 domain-containing protein [Oscillospiraceae bacterium]
MKTKKRRKLNIVDVIIFLLVAALLAGGYFLFARSTEGEVTAEFRYTVTFRNLPTALLDNIDLGHIVRTGDGFVPIGEIISIRHETSRVRAGLDSHGRPVYRELPTMVTLHLTISGQAVQRGAGMVVNGVAVNIGQEIQISTHDFWGVGIISG